MASFTIKSIPEPLLIRLRDRATRHRRSINSELLICLEQALNVPPVDATALLARADVLRARWGKRPLLTDRILKKAKTTGRP